jgi:hypothetical protein
MSWQSLHGPWLYEAQKQLQGRGSLSPLCADVLDSIVEYLVDVPASRGLCAYCGKRFLIEGRLRCCMRAPKGAYTHLDVAFDVLSAISFMFFPNGKDAWRYIISQSRPNDPKWGMMSLMGGYLCEFYPSRTIIGRLEALDRIKVVDQELYERQQIYGIKCRIVTCRDLWDEKRRTASDLGVAVVEGRSYLRPPGFSRQGGALSYWRGFWPIYFNIFCCGFAGSVWRSMFGRFLRRLWWRGRAVDFPGDKRQRRGLIFVRGLPLVPAAPRTYY